MCRPTGLLALCCIAWYIALHWVVLYYIVLYCILQKQKSQKHKYCAECLFWERPAGNTQSHGKLINIHSKQKQLYESGIQNPALVWAVLKHIGTSKNTNAALKSLTSAQVCGDNRQPWLRPCITASTLQKWTYILRRLRFGCPWGRVIKNGHTRDPRALTMRNAFVNAQLHIRLTPGMFNWGTLQQLTIKRKERKEMKKSDEKELL